MSNTNVQVWDRASINHLLMTNDKAVRRALVLLLNNQTAEEQNTGTTVESNGKGFTGADAEILTSLAKWVQERKPLSVKQMAICRKVSKTTGVCKLAKYWKQLAAEIPAKQAKIEAAKAETVVAAVLAQTQQKTVIQPVKAKIEASDWGTW